MPAERLRAMGQGHWLAFYGLVLGAWTLLYAMQVPADLAGAARLFGPELWAALCAVEPGVAGAPTVFLMWAAMAAGMMAPTALPALVTYDDLRVAQAGSGAGFAALAAGYLAVWLGFAAAATAAQIGMAEAGLVTPLGASASVVLSAGLLAMAGVWQLSSPKAACLARCRAPFGFFMAHWPEGPWRMGLRLGLVCLGCCWALMALAFVGGAMNLAFMGGAMLLMAVEKLPAGRIVTRPLGWALLGAAALTLVI